MSKIVCKSRVKIAKIETAYQKIFKVHKIISKELWIINN
jgi:hypothetical protein